MLNNYTNAYEGVVIMNTPLLPLIEQCGYNYTNAYEGVVNMNTPLIPLIEQCGYNYTNAYEGVVNMNTPLLPLIEQCGYNTPVFPMHTKVNGTRRYWRRKYFISLIANTIIESSKYFFNI